MSARLPGGGKNIQVVNGKEKVVRVKVSDVSYLEYDSIEEAIQELGKAKCLDHINAQVATNAKNLARAQAVGGPTEKDLMNEVFNRVASNTELMAEYVKYAGDKARQQAFMSKQLADLKAEKGIVEDEDEAADA
jgi:hypothetical protein